MTTISYDTKRLLIDFNLERDEDHATFTIGELQDIIANAFKVFQE